MYLQYVTVDLLICSLHHLFTRNSVVTSQNFDHPLPSNCRLHHKLFPKTLLFIQSQMSSSATLLLVDQKEPQQLAVSKTSHLCLPWDKLFMEHPKRDAKLRTRPSWVMVRETSAENDNRTELYWTSSWWGFCNPLTWFYDEDLIDKLLLLFVKRRHFVALFEDRL